MIRKQFYPADTGLSLIELVVAMALFAMVAIMGLQSLTGTMRISERLTQIDSDTAELGNAVALLRNDLTSVVPMLFYPPQGAPHRAVDLSQDGTLLGLSLAGQKTFAPAHTDRHRAEWSVDAAQGTLIRRFWPALLPADSNQLSADMTVLSGVRSLTLRTFWPDVGWVAGDTPPMGALIIVQEVSVDQDSIGAPPSASFSILPIAVEVTLQTERHGNLRLVQTLQ